MEDEYLHRLPSGKEINVKLDEQIESHLKINIDVGYNYIQDNTKSVIKKRKIWKVAITSEIAKEYWFVKFKNKYLNDN